MSDRKIIADSSCDTSKEILERTKVEKVPFNIEIDGEHYIDHEDLDIEEFVRLMDAGEKTPKSSAPSPQLFIDRFEESAENFVITISSKLSATYSNACLAKDMFLENHKTKIHVIDSKSASAGETLVAIKLREFIEENNSFEEITGRIEEFVSNMKTFFILDEYDNLVKNGRMKQLAGAFIKALSIKPIMGADDGSIKLFGKGRGYQKAVQNLVKLVGEQKKDLKESILVIAHCNAKDRALNCKEMIEEKYNFKKIEIVETGMLSSVYANNGGIVIAF